MDVSVLCRSCMKEVASWEKENFDTRTVEMFCYCTNILITDDDRLPKQFCYDCFIKIESSYTFVKEAQKMNIIMKNIIFRSQASVIIEADSQHKPYILPDMDHNSNASNFSLPDCELSNNVEHFYDKSLFDIVQEESACHLDDTKDAETTETLQLNSNCENGHIIAPSLNNRDSFTTSTPPHAAQTEQDQDNPSETFEDVPQGITKKNTPKAVSQNKLKCHICAICRKTFVFQTWLDRHMAKEHTGCEYTCDHCSKTFSVQSQLQSHLLSHSEARSFSCSTCGAGFKRRKHLTAHARSHSDHRPYICQECGMRFKLKSVLKTHARLHDRQKPYLCSICGWSFAQAGNLEVHMRRHTGEKPYQCGECPFKCSVASSLVRHRSRHRAEPRHVCGRCRRAFYDASGLARHARTHTGELPYKCPYCPRAFVDSWKRKSHLMRTHSLALRDIPTLPRDPGLELGATRGQNDPAPLKGRTTLHRGPGLELGAT